MNKFVLAAASALLVTAAPAFAKTATVGDMVVGPNGGEVGTVAAVDGDIVTVDTGMHKAALPTAALGETETGWSITVSKNDLNAMVSQQKAAAKADLMAKLIPGAPVVGAEGSAVATVQKVEGDLVTIEHDGAPYKLPVDTFFAQGETVAMAMTLAQFKAAISAGASADSEPRMDPDSDTPQPNG